jgi:hypothetical protein
MIKVLLVNGRRGDEEMSTGFEKRYAGLTRDECQHTAILIMRHAVQTGKWDDVPERLMELRKVMAYAPVPECRTALGKKAVK